ncbi:hypothetical protein C7450_101821 [Chelatococcus asaccharovorans]|uniref:Uncharacterized protein n=1 Tax=Chelatococcus asaccharovorans TaxID=28210 RepID=A0A2V3UWI0_9HYPH|nr:hypothetical protein C7450_101821 [Chelatococcus asaccharovorans]
MQTLARTLITSHFENKLDAIAAIGRESMYERYAVAVDEGDNRFQKRHASSNLEMVGLARLRKSRSYFHISAPEIRYARSPQKILEHDPLALAFAEFPKSSFNARQSAECKKMMPHVDRKGVRLPEQRREQQLGTPRYIQGAADVPGGRDRCNGQNLASWNVVSFKQVLFKPCLRSQAKTNWLKGDESTASPLDTHNSFRLEMRDGLENGVLMNSEPARQSRARRQLGAYRKRACSNFLTEGGADAPP